MSRASGKKQNVYLSLIRELSGKFVDDNLIRGCQRLLDYIEKNGFRQSEDLDVDICRMQMNLKKYRIDNRAVGHFLSKTAQYEDVPYKDL